MGFFKTEEVTVPLRYLILVAHLVLVLAIFLDVDIVTSNVSDVPGNIDSTPAALQDYWDKLRKQIYGFSIAAFACFIIEFVSIFSGFTLFMRPTMLLNIVLHAAGLATLIVFYNDARMAENTDRLWSINAYFTFIAAFCFFPMVIELVLILFVMRYNYLRY